MSLCFFKCQFVAVLSIEVVAVKNVFLLLLCKISPRCQQECFLSFKTLL